MTKEQSKISKGVSHVSSMSEAFILSNICVGNNQWENLASGILYSVFHHLVSEIPHSNSVCKIYIQQLKMGHCV